jgi:hypothetical protein
MAYTTIDDPTIYFNTIVYSGDASSTRNITGVGFRPDWVWIKRRNSTAPNVLYDVVRGGGKQLRSDDTSAEASNSIYGYVSDFISDGFEVTGGSTNLARVNASGGTYVAWNWLASNTTASNTDGSITSSVSANTTAGFSIVSYTGTGSAATVGHGLGVAPSLYIVKNRSSAQAWRVFVSLLGADKILRLNATNASSTDTSMWNNTSPTSSVFSIGTPSQVNTSGENYIAYCFAEKKGYSKIGSYTGNGSNSGSMIWTGFKPSMVIYKKSSGTENWFIHDNKRQGFNPDNELLFPDLSNAEGTVNRIDLLSNGFKATTSDGGINGSGATYIYMAFAESPFVNSSGIPCNAR